MKIVNKLLKNICIECHFDLLPLHWRRPNLMLLLISRTSMHPQHHFLCHHKRGRFILQLHPVWYRTNIKCGSLSEHILLFNLKFEMTSNLQLNERYDVIKLGPFSSAKFTWKMSIKLLISYTTVFVIQFSFEMCS